MLLNEDLVVENEAGWRFLEHSTMVYVLEVWRDVTSRLKQDA
jgi:hypothetical protein